MSQKDLEKIMNPEEAKEYVEILKKAMVGMIKDQAENQALREKYAKESLNPPRLMKGGQYYRLDLHLRGKQALAVINLLEELDKFSETKGDKC